MGGGQGSQEGGGAGVPRGRRVRGPGREERQGPRREPAFWVCDVADAQLPGGLWSQDRVAVECGHDELIRGGQACSIGCLADLVSWAAEQTVPGYCTAPEATQASLAQTTSLDFQKG